MFLNNIVVVVLFIVKVIGITVIVFRLFIATNIFCVNYVCDVASVGGWKYLTFSGICV